MSVSGWACWLCFPEVESQTHELHAGAGGGSQGRGPFPDAVSVHQRIKAAQGGGECGNGSQQYELSQARQ